MDFALLWFMVDHTKKTPSLLRGWWLKWNPFADTKSPTTPWWAMGSVDLVLGSGYGSCRFSPCLMLLPLPTKISPRKLSHWEEDIRFEGFPAFFREQSRSFSGEPGGDFCWISNPSLFRVPLEGVNQKNHKNAMYLKSVLPFGGVFPVGAIFARWSN